jgi:preprotein translocase subunit SecE
MGLLESVLIGIAVTTTVFAFTGIFAIVDWAARKLDR